MKNEFDGTIERLLSAGIFLPQAVGILERGMITAALKTAEGNQCAAAKTLGIHRNTLQRLREVLAKYRKERGARLPITVFKELTGITRKYAIPLLEHLDREQVTRRAGDERVIL